MVKIERQEGSRLKTTGEAPLSINSQEFEEIREEISRRITACFVKLNKGTFTGGVITAKIIIGLDDEMVKDNEGKYHHIPKPLIDYVVKLTMQTESENTKGSINVDKELVSDEDGFYLQEKRLGQSTMNI